jgi:hypothetical protein
VVNLRELQAILEEMLPKVRSRRDAQAEAVRQQQSHSSTEGLN